jgi:Pentapeptide repeats (8 copies)
MLFWARLQGADLREAQLQGTMLFQARLQGAHLGGAQLLGADRSQARLWRAKLDAKTELGLTDLVGADFATPLTEEETADFQAAIDVIRRNPVNAINKKLMGFRNDQAKEASDRLFGTEKTEDELLFRAGPEQQVLVSDAKARIFEKLPSEWLITSPMVSYERPLIAQLADQLAPQAPAIAENIANRATEEMRRTDTDNKLRSLYGTIACRLLENAKAEKVSLERSTKVDLSRELEHQKIECDAAIRPLPPIPQGAVFRAGDIISAPQ